MFLEAITVNQLFIETIFSPLDCYDHILEYCLNLVGGGSRLLSVALIQNNVVYSQACA